MCQWMVIHTLLIAIKTLENVKLMLGLRMLLLYNFIIKYFIDLDQNE
jgi:hypothetical protein